MKSISRKNPVLPVEKFPSLVLLRNAVIFTMTFYYPISTQLTVKLSLTEDKNTMENFKLLVLKVVMVAYERWSLTRGFKYCDLTWKLLVLWKTSC